jgi:hypothetical protein
MNPRRYGHHAAGIRVAVRHTYARNAHGAASKLPPVSHAASRQVA